MTKASIYQFVKDKLLTHGIEKTEDGALILHDQKLFSLFVELERAVRKGSFDAVQTAALGVETYLISIEKRRLMAFAYMYLRFSDLAPKITKADEHLPDGCVRKSSDYRRQVSKEEMLIGLWATVKFEQEGEKFLRVVYAASQISN